MQGTGFTGDQSSVELFVGSIKQETSSISESEAIFTITNVTSPTISSLDLFFDVGIPEGVLETSLTLTPKLVSVSPNSGSIGGSLITAIVPGASSTATIIDSDGNSIC